MEFISIPFSVVMELRPPTKENPVTRSTQSFGRQPRWLEGLTDGGGDS